MFTIGITGGSGFIGSHLAKALAKKYKVRIFDVREPHFSSVEGEIEFVYCDIRSFEDVKKALSDVDLVIHAAIIQIPYINERKRLGYEVNVIGTQNVCEAVNQSARAKGLILLSSWHVWGEYGLEGCIDEDYGYNPNKVDERGRLYVLSKIAQEVIVRFYEELSDKLFLILRLGTVLGEGMPEKTAAHIFITNAIEGKPLTPYKHVMYKPMFYVDIIDVVKVVEVLVDKILAGGFKKFYDSSKSIITCAYPEPITILELAETIRDLVIELTNGLIKPTIEIVDLGKPQLFNPDDKFKVRLNIRRLKEYLGIEELTPPRETLRRLVKQALEKKYGTKLSSTQKHCS